MGLLLPDAGDVNVRGGELQFQTHRRPSPSGITCPIAAIQCEGSREQFSHKEAAHVRALINFSTLARTTD